MVHTDSKYLRQAVKNQWRMAVVQGYAAAICANASGGPRRIAGTIRVDGPRAGERFDETVCCNRELCDARRDAGSVLGGTARGTEGAGRPHERRERESGRLSQRGVQRRSRNLLSPLRGVGNDAAGA